MKPWQENRKETKNFFLKKQEEGLSLNASPWTTLAVGKELQNLVIDGTIKEGMVAMDIGCGLGIETMYLAKQGLTATGIDFMPKTIDAAREIAKLSEANANFISIKGPELISMWVGESEKGIREVFKKARQSAPTIVFFDEIDAVAARRGLDANSKATERVVNQLLTEMDGLEDLNNVVVIGATNRPDMVDPGLLRPGRFDRIISTSLPDIKSMEAIFKVHMKNMPLKNVDINKLVEKTENYAGSDIESLCREAAMIALRINPEADIVEMEHFEQALEKVKPSVNDKDLKKYKEIEENYLRKARTATIRESPTYLG